MKAGLLGEDMSMSRVSSQPERGTFCRDADSTALESETIRSGADFGL